MLKNCSPDTSLHYGHSQNSITAKEIPSFSSSLYASSAQTRELPEGLPEAQTQTQGSRLIFARSKVYYPRLHP